MRKREKRPSPDFSGRPFSPGSELDLRVDSLAFGGEGVARHRGWVVLVEGGLPGDRVVVRLSHLARNFARARVEKILEPAPSRIPAPCTHFPRCGGCAYQNLDYPAQLEAKRRQLVDLLERVGGFPHPRVAPVVAAPHPISYRARMAYGIQGGAVAATGLHERDNPSRVLEVESCLLPEIALQTAYLRAKEAFRHLPPGIRPFQVEILGSDDGELPVAVLHGTRPPAGELVRAARVWTARDGFFAGVVWRLQEGEGRRKHRGSLRILAGAGHVFQRLGPYRYRVPAGCFFQGNPALATLLFQETAGRCGADPGGVLELFSGVGALSLFLGGAGSRVLGVEGDPVAVRAAVENTAQNRVGGVDFQLAAVDREARRLVETGTTFGTVVADPPRVGLGRETARRLALIARRRILYVSCDPATLARDLKEIQAQGGWHLAEVIPFDMFPQTAGIECLADLRPGEDAQEGRSRTSPIRRAS